jgi:glycosidase
MSIFNYPFGDYGGKLIKVLNSRGNATIVNTWATALQTSNNAYSEVSPDYIDAPFLSNHDVGRIYGFVNGDEVRVKAAGAMNLFMSGAAFIYYGEEIGMPGEGNDPSKRAPMVWTSDNSGGETTLPPGCVLPAEGYPLGSLAEQKDDETSVYSFYREAIAIRNALPVISHGDSTAETALNVGCISAVRKTWNDDECIILMNINDEADTVDLSAYADWKMVATLSPDGNPTEMDGTTLNMAAYGIAILVPGN